MLNIRTETDLIKKLAALHALARDVHTSMADWVILTREIGDLERLFAAVA